MSFSMKLAKTILLATLGTSLLAGTAQTARADDDKCRREIHKAEEKLEKAIRKHGERSPQAERSRRELEEARERCHMHEHDRDHDHH
jgi:septal ring factor EnvC (AmiA/AmiB activator)